MGGLYQFVLKALASGVLAWIMALCVWGLYRVWWPSGLVYRNFAYTRDGADDSASGLHFTQLVNLEFLRLNRLLSPPAGIDAPLVIPTANQQGGRVAAIELPGLPQSLLPALEIQAYGIQISALVNRLFQQIAPPNEIVGTVTERKGQFDGYVEVHQAARSYGDDVPAALANQLATKEDAAFAIACRIYRMLGIQRGMVYAQASDAEFEVFARALQQYQLYRSSLAEVRPPQVAEQAIKETERLLNGLIQQKTQFPLVYKLAAVEAYSKGQTKEAIAFLETYEKVWPASVQKDPNLQDLLQEYRRKDTQVLTQLSAIAARSTQEVHLKAKMRPVQPGFSVGSSNGSTPSTGTICCLVRDAGTPNGPRYILSAEHILGTSLGSQIIQPATLDGGDPKQDVIATVERAIAVKPGQQNTAAGTIAKLSVDANPALPQFSFAGLANGQLGQTVRMVGRTSGLIEGTITAVNVDTQISLPEGIRAFSGLIEVRRDGAPFSNAGDSGAPVVDAQNRLIGMVFAGSGTHSFIMPIEPILKELHVELLTQ